MNEVWITDLAVTTGLGPTLAATWQGLMAGRTAIRPVTRFTTDHYSSRLAACVADLEPERPGGSRLWPLLERTAAQLAPPPPGARLLTATTKGAIDVLERGRRGWPADPDAWSLPRLLTRISRHLGLATDGGANINAACASSTIALAQGAAAIAAGRAEAVVVCCMDLVSEFAFSGFSALRALAPTPCQPFDRDHAGLSLGEGAAIIVMVSAELARREKRPCRGTILGWGVANDATHITAPARDGCGLIQALQQALRRAAVTPDTIAGIGAHGTGTVHNDQMELTAFRAVFGAAIPPVLASKGALGHTLGAAGGIELALGLQALAMQQAPPTVGLRHPMEGAAALACSEAVALRGECLLRCNSGFGGINAALVLGRGRDG
ncbi:MAG: beta-ketoacyl synthase N-terminal-like domain-containing protein [bacterium]